MDKDLLRKIFESNTMTDKQVAEMFGTSRSTISVRRRELQVKAGRIVCNICGEPKRASCYNSEFPGVCISCRRATGLEDITERSGRPVNTTKVMRVKCLRYTEGNEHYFLSPVSVDGRTPVNHICPKHRFCNRWWGENEEPLAIRMG
jgi:hypothetical protein